MKSADRTKTHRAVWNMEETKAELKMSIHSHIREVGTIL